MWNWFQHFFQKAPEDSSDQKEEVRTYKLAAFYKAMGDYYPQKEEQNFIKALTHSSFSGRPGSNFEQLEFLGDAVLSAVVTEILFHQYPSKKEGELSKMKSFIVSRRQLNEVANNLGLQAFISHKIDPKKINEARHMGGDVLEAVLGAYFLDSGLDTVKSIAQKWIVTEEVLTDAAKGVIDPKSMLHEWAQKRKKKVEFKHKQSNTPNQTVFEVEVWIDGVMTAEASGISKKEAERSAAEIIVSKFS